MFEGKDRERRGEVQQRGLMQAGKCFFFFLSFFFFSFFLRRASENIFLNLHTCGRETDPPHVWVGAVHPAARNVFDGLREAEEARHPVRGEHHDRQVLHLVVENPVFIFNTREVKIQKKERMKEATHTHTISRARCAHTHREK